MTLAPDATFPSMFLARVGGGTVHLGGSGSGLVLFFRSDCPASAYAAHAVGRIAEALQPRGLAVVGVAQDDAGDAAAFAAVNGMGTVVLSTDVTSWLASSAVDLGFTPTAFLVDQGRILAVVEGWTRHEYNALAGRAAQLVGAEAPTASAVGDGLPDFEAPSAARNAG